MGSVVVLGPDAVKVVQLEVDGAVPWTLDMLLDVKVTAGVDPVVGCFQAEGSVTSR